jgi:hypothetical protein
MADGAANDKRYRIKGIPGSTGTSEVRLKDLNLT